MVASAKSFGLFSSKMDNFTTVNWEGSGRNTFFFLHERPTVEQSWAAA